MTTSYESNGPWRANRTNETQKPDSWFLETGVREPSNLSIDFISSDKYVRGYVRSLLAQQA